MRNKYEQIVFLFETPPVSSFYNRYGMGMFIENGYDIKVVDMSALLNPQSMDVDTASLLAQNDHLVINHPKTRKEFVEILHNLSEPFIWSAIPLYAESLWYIKKISVYDYGFLNNMDYFEPISRNERVKTKEYWTKWTKSRFYNGVLYRFPHNYIPIHKAKVVMAYSQESINFAKHASLWGRKTSFILANTIDYSECLKTKRASANIINKPYYVFIDEYLPFHPDGIKSGFKLDAEEYYKALRRLFFEIEKATGKEVIIAAHPKANYRGDKAWCYEGYKIYQFKTAELILYSDVVILDYACLARSMVVTYNKPAIYITTDGLENDDIYRLIHKEAKKKCVNIYNISKGEDRIKLIASIDDEIKESMNRNQRELSNYSLYDNHPNKDLLFEEVLLRIVENTN